MQTYLNYSFSIISMVNQQLVEYIKKGTEKGHTIQYLREYLVKSGQDLKEVDEAITYLWQNKPKPSKKLPSEKLEITESSKQGIKRRNPFLVLLFTIITFGIYGIFWLVFTTNELRENTKSAPNPWLLLLFLIPLVNIIFYFVYFWKYSKAINELTGFSLAGLYILWIIFAPVAMILAQMELNKRA